MAKQSGIQLLLSEGFTQAQLARMFDVDTCTTHQWVRANRIGERMVGRVKFIPELKAKYSPEQLRPDLPPNRIRVTAEAARLWWNDEATKDRAKEVPGERANGKSKAAPKAKKAAPKSKSKAKSKKPGKASKTKATVKRRKINEDVATNAAPPASKSSQAADTVQF